MKKAACRERSREPDTGWEAVTVIQVRDDIDLILEWREVNGLGVYFEDRADRVS